MNSSAFQERRSSPYMQMASLTSVTPPSDDSRCLLGQTNSPAMQALERMVAKLAPTNIPLLLIGESGTGKEILAQQIHQLSPKGSQPLVKLICAFLSAESLSAHLTGAAMATDRRAPYSSRRLTNWTIQVSETFCTPYPR